MLICIVASGVQDVLSGLTGREHVQCDVNVLDGGVSESRDCSTRALANDRGTLPARCQIGQVQPQIVACLL